MKIHIRLVHPILKFLKTTPWSVATSDKWSVDSNEFLSCERIVDSELAGWILPIAPEKDILSRCASRCECSNRKLYYCFIFCVTLRLFYSRKNATDNHVDWRWQR